MNLKALSLGAVLGFLVAVVPSCGTPTCGPQNCNGCCDSMNKCVPQSASSSNSSCGRGGNVCVDCAANAQTCNTTSFSCEVVGGTGGGSGGTGGGTMGGGTGGGTTGGGTGGGTTGGGTGGGTTGGGTGGGGGLVTGCSASAQNCANAGESCIYTDQMGSTACFPGACDIVTQNCPNASDKCSYLGLADGGVGRGCAPAGTLTEGQACGPNSDLCAKGMACVNGACAKYCYTSNNCTAATNGQCVGILQIGGTDERPATCVNIAMCDPLLQNCAASTDACSLTANGPGCIPAGTAAVGAMCGNTGGNCVKGAICLGNATAATCHAFCNRDGGMPTCATGTCGGVTNQMGQVQVFGACQ